MKHVANYQSATEQSITLFILGFVIQNSDLVTGQTDLTRSCTFLSWVTCVAVTSQSNALKQSRANQNTVAKAKRKNTRTLL